MRGAVALGRSGPSQTWIQGVGGLKSARAGAACTGGLARQRAPQHAAAMLHTAVLALACMCYTCIVYQHEAKPTSKELSGSLPAPVALA